MDSIKDQYKAELSKVNWEQFDKRLRSSYKSFANSMDPIEFEPNEIDELLFQLSRLNDYLGNKQTLYLYVVKPIFTS